MSRWVSGVTLKRYYGFSEYAMRLIRDSDAVVRNSHCTWLYDIDNRKISQHTTIKGIPIPEHLIKYTCDA